VPGSWKDLVDCLPETKRAVADGQIGSDLEPTLRVPVDRDHGFRWKMITQSGGT
jgi:hypothetical protein